MPRVSIIVIFREHFARENDLLEVSYADHPPGRFFCPGQRGEQQRGKNSNDRNDDQQLDHRKRPSRWSAPLHFELTGFSLVLQETIIFANVRLTAH